MYTGNPWSRSQSGWKWQDDHSKCQCHTESCRHEMVTFTWHSGSTECVWSTPLRRPGGGPRTGRGSHVVLAAGSLGPCRSKTCSLLSLLPSLSPEKLAFINNLYTQKHFIKICYPSWYITFSAIQYDNVLIYEGEIFCAGKVWREVN